MYRNAAYLPNTQTMRLYTWDEDGKRISYDTTYEPYLYLETNNTPDAKSIFNTSGCTDVANSCITLDIF